MKYLWLLLLLSPAWLLAQTRVATPAELNEILPLEQRKKLIEHGHKMVINTELSLIEKQMINKVRNSDPANEDAKAYIQRLYNAGLSKEEVNGSINALVQDAAMSVPYNSKHKYGVALSKEKEELFDSIMKEIDKKSKAGTLTESWLKWNFKDPLLKEAMQDPEWVASQKKVEDFKKLLQDTHSGSTFTPVIEEIDLKAVNGFKVTVPEDFTIADFKRAMAQQNKVSTSSPILDGKDCVMCQTIAGPQPNTEIDQLQKYMETINKVTGSSGKPLIKEMWFAWGYNRNFHLGGADSTFTFEDGSSFTIHDAQGKDRPSPFDPKVYFNPSTISIPQYNVDLGVMFNDNWGLELSQNHMKWVFDNTKPYDISGTYNHRPVVKNPNPTNEWDTEIPVDFEVAKKNRDATWMRFEHSDGYNYVSLGAIYRQNLWSSKSKKVMLDARFGAGAGLMVPKTMVAMHQDARWNSHGLDNKFHIAGGGAHVDVGLKATFLNTVFLQAVARGTHIKVEDALVDGSGARLEQSPITSIQVMGQVGVKYTFDRSQRIRKKPASVD